MKRLAANAFYKAGQRDAAAQLCRQVNQQTPTVSTLLLEAKFRKNEKKYDSAIELLTAAQRSIEGHKFLWT
jgi:predicted translin family RNA/ssDNA-binding protein